MINVGRLAKPAKEHRICMFCGKDITNQLDRNKEYVEINCCAMRVANNMTEVNVRYVLSRIYG